jgi:hypothetical protein
MGRWFESTRRHQSKIEARRTLTREIASRRPESPPSTGSAEEVADNSLRLASIWWPVAFALTAIYFVFISRRYAGKVSVKRDTQGYY